MPIRKAKGLDFLENNDLRKHTNLSIFPNETFYCYQRLPLFPHDREGSALNWELGTRVRIPTVP